MDFSNKKIAILGLGIENQELIKWLILHKANNITICDKNINLKKSFSISKKQFPINFQFSDIKFQIGQKYLEKLEKFDVIYRTPGIPVNLPQIKKAKKLGVKISSQMKLFFENCPAKIIGITGTKGKGTTTSLIYEILMKNFQLPITNFQINSKYKKLKSQTNVYIAGNIGNPPIEFLDKLTKNDWVVLELSSFQLQDLDISPHIAVVLNITSDHLDYHKDNDEYIKAKTNIVRYQKKNDYAIINQDYLTSFRFAAISQSQDYYFSKNKSVDLGTFIKWTKKKDGAYWGEIILRTNQKDISITKTYNLKLRGEHNLENICAAVTASYLAGVNIKSIKNILENFKGLTHRIELFYEKSGIRFYDDSASTNPDTTIAAIKSFTEPIILIAGGSSKGADYINLGKEIVKSTVKAVILMGDTGPAISRAIINSKSSLIDNTKFKLINNVKTLKDAVNIVNQNIKLGDIVLLSPASASFDNFKNYKDRGEQFKNNVKNVFK